MITTNESKKLWDLISPLKTGMLVTSHNDQLQARPMHLVQSHFDGTLYFFTAVPSEKEHEINQDNEVCLTFSCPKSQTYVSLSGIAWLNRDQELINSLWNPFVSAWFPQGKEDKSVSIIQIATYQAEYWQGEGTRLTQLYKYAKSLAVKKPPHIGEHEVINLQ